MSEKLHWRDRGKEWGHGSGQFYELFRGSFPLGTVTLHDGKFIAQPHKGGKRKFKTLTAAKADVLREAKLCIRFDPPANNLCWPQSTLAPCRICGAPESEAHHEDYSKPLDVDWLCRKDHAELHRRMNGN